MAAFLKNLFTPKWQHSDAKIRLASINAQSDVQILKTLAAKDLDLDVRLKAISYLQNSTDLNELIADKSPKVKQAAIKQFLFINLGSHELTEQNQKIAQINDSQMLMTIATMADNKELAQTALSNINDEQQLFNFISQSPSAKARQLAIEKIQQASLLKAIEQQFKNKDKTLTRIAKSKLADLQEAQEKLQKSLAQTKSLLEQALLLAKASFKPTYLAELTHLKQAWKKAQQDEQQQVQFTQAIKECDGILSQNKEIQNALVEKQQNNQQAQDQQKQTLDKLQQVFDTCKSGIIGEEGTLIDDLTAIQAAWSNAAQLHKAGNAIQKEYDALLIPLLNLNNSLLILKKQTTETEKVAEEFQPLMKQLKNSQSQIKAVNWPKEFPEGKQLHQIESQLKQIKDAIETHKKNEKQTLSTISSTLDTLEKNIEEGHIKNAKQQQSKVRKLLRQIPTQNDKSFNGRFIALTEQLDELKDWQGFATAPKMEQLCSDMENLIGAQTEATELSNQIHDLQDQWKSLGGLPDKHQHQTLWLRFKTAADTAYEPCKLYYQNLTKIKQYNKEQKEEICKQIEMFYEQNDWANADWKTVQSLMNQVNIEYKKYSPVENSAHKTLQSRFHQATKLIQDKISHYYQENAEQKQLLVDKAKELYEQEDLQSAIEACKNLQQKWKSIASAGRQEHGLWKTFREQCDALFNRRSEQNEAHKQQVINEKNQAKLLMEKAATLMAANDTESLIVLQTLKISLSELDLPHGYHEQKIQELNKVEEQVKQNQLQLSQQTKQALWVTAIEISEKMAQWELNPQEDKEGLENQLQQTQLPKGVLEVFQKRLSDTQDHKEEDYLNLCLELEISLEVESPASDQAARMAMQVKRLQQNMGKKQPNAQQQLQDLKLNWFALRATGSHYSEYSSRFSAALDHAK